MCRKDVKIIPKSASEKTVAIMICRISALQRDKARVEPGNQLEPNVIDREDVRRLPSDAGRQ
jgi:hypothetical protein